eukprot:366323-Chlamydomonas_euryale.AAC.9
MAALHRAVEACRGEHSPLFAVLGVPGLAWQPWRMVSSHCCTALYNALLVVLSCGGCVVVHRVMHALAQSHLMTTETRKTMRPLFRTSPVFAAWSTCQARVHGARSAVLLPGARVRHACMAVSRANCKEIGNRTATSPRSKCEWLVPTVTFLYFGHPPRWCGHTESPNKAFEPLQPSAQPRPRTARHTCTHGASCRRLYKRP